MFYSCEAVSWAKLYCGALGFFLQFKEFELYWGAVFFTTGRGVLEKSFFNQFYCDFWSGKWNAWKNLEWFWRWTKVKSQNLAICQLCFSLFQFWCASSASTAAIFRQSTSYVRVLDRGAELALLLVLSIYWLIVTLISTGYDSAPIFFYFVEQKNVSLYLIAFSTFCVKSFWHL